MTLVTGVSSEVRVVEDGIELMALVNLVAKLVNLLILLITDRPTPFNRSANPGVLSPTVSNRHMYVCSPSAGGKNTHSFMSFFL